MLKPALFLDRDGVVIFDSGYAKEADQVRLMPGIVDLIRRAQQKDWKIIVITNQSGLGRGWITLPQYQSVSARMIKLLSDQQILIDGIYFAPWFAGNTTPPDNLRSSQFLNAHVLEKGRWCPEWRKPWPGMIWEAAQDHSLDLNHSVMIGDRATDQMAAVVAGIAKTYLCPIEKTNVERDLIPTLQGKILDLAIDAREWLKTQAHLQNLLLRLPPVETLALQPQLIEDFAEVEIL